MRFLLFSSLLVLFTCYLTGCGSSPAKSSEKHEKATLTAIAEATVLSSTPTAVENTNTPTVTLASAPPPPMSPGKAGQSRGYLTTPAELTVIKQKADQGIEPYADAVAAVLKWADKKWDYNLKEKEKCNENASRPVWLDEENGVPRLYSRALAYNLTNESHYAEEVKTILERIMTEVTTIAEDDGQCRLNFAWGTPELVASADLIEAYWHDQTCTGPTSTFYTNTEIGSGPCKKLFQNWLVKNPYYITSYSAVSNNNWGAATTNEMAYIADYLWDRPEVLLMQRNHAEVNEGKDSALSPSEAYAYLNELMLKRMNGYGIEYSSDISCDTLSGPQQSDAWPPVKSQITEKGIVPEDARREEYCNIPQYNGEYQNYPQLHLSNNIQQCELMLRRGSNACYENIDNTDVPTYTFTSPDGTLKTTHLYPGRGSLERAIKAIIVDSNTEWKHDSGLAVAYRYYYSHHKLDGIEQWPAQLDAIDSCSQDICFGMLTHGFAPDETPGPPPAIAPP